MFILYDIYDIDALVVNSISQNTDLHPYKKIKLVFCY